MTGEGRSSIDDERLEALMQFGAFIEELRRAGRASSG